jgi:Ran GTPase-activating protein (RanGAP) involved in mRNA processing and transport
MLSSTQRFTIPSNHPVSEALIASENPVALEIHSEEQIHPANFHHPQFDDHGVHAFLDFPDLKLIDPNTLINFTEGKIPRDEEILSKIAMYALQHEPKVFLWLIGPHSGVTSISFTSHGMNDDQVAKLAKLLQGNKILASLTLSNSKISVEGVKEIAKTLPSTALKSLNLESSNIGDAGVVEIAAALPNTGLTSLDLSGPNDISDMGITAFAISLQENKKLTSLILHKSNISNAGAQAIAKVLSSTALTSLNLTWNNIGDTGVAAIAEKLPGSTLTSLDLEFNNIDDAGAKAIAEVLPKTILISLDLKWNNIGITGATAIAKALKNNGTLTTLSLFDDNLPLGENSEAVETIKKKIEKNRSDAMEKIRQQLSTTFTGSKQVADNMRSGFPSYGLPKEVTQEILKYLGHKDLLNMQNTHRPNPIVNGVTPTEQADTNTTKT